MFLRFRDLVYKLFVMMKLLDVKVTHTKTQMQQLRVKRSLESRFVEMEMKKRKEKQNRKNGQN